MQKPARVFSEVIRHLFKKPATSSYPFTPAQPMPNFRGRIDFNSALCIGCQMCVRVCPAKAIEIPLSAEQPPAPAPVEGQPAVPAKKKFDCIMKLDHCVYCAQCVETCPKKALIMTQDFELAQVDKKKLRRHYK
ncbi:MAG: 4Fe-4S binding protein [Elusimicrobiales bacterium]|nr:4Fe-4S binding protein [Elusimicrobiales bacterium]